MAADPIAAVMVHVADVEAATAWYRQAFPEAVSARDEASGFEFLSIGQVQLEIVLADEKVGCGAFGSVVYWRVPDFDAALRRLQGIGATLHRGPMRIEQGCCMCQVKDPWGNCIGLRGPAERP